jgi:hypothetical protein
MRGGHKKSAAVAALLMSAFDPVVERRPVQRATTTAMARAWAAIARTAVVAFSR